MITREKADKLEKLMGQLEGIHSEISALAKKSSNDGVNLFKLKIVNAVLQQCNEMLGKEYQPIGDFEQFDDDQVPSNSDVTFVASQYLQALEKLRSDNIITAFGGGWIYNLPKDSGTSMRAASPTSAKLRK
jgi:hypothetical protein